MNDIRNVQGWMLGWITRMNEVRKVRMNVRMNNKNEWDKECKNVY